MYRVEPVLVVLIEPEVMERWEGEMCDLGQSCLVVAPRREEERERKREREGGEKGQLTPRHLLTPTQALSAELTGSLHSNCFSQASLLSTNPLSFVATGLGCE